MIKMITTAALVALMATGCATAPQKQLSDAELRDLEPVVCESEVACQKAWQRAQLWIVNNSSYKIQIANDVVIQTFNPTQSSVRSGFTVTKEPVSGDKQAIKMRSYCDNMFGCRPTHTELLLSFNRYLRGS